MSFRRILASYFALLLFLAIIAVSCFTYFTVRNIFIDQITHGMLEMSKSTGQVITEVVNEQLAEAKSLAISSSVIELADGQSNPETADRVAENERSILALRDLEDVFVTNKKGIILSSSTRASVGQNISEQAYFKESIDGLEYISNLVAFQNESNNIVYTYPIKKGSTIVGVVGIVQSGKAFSHYLDSIKVNDTQSSYAYMTDAKGMMIYHPTNEKIGLMVENDVIKGVASQIQQGQPVQDSVVTYMYHGIKKIAAYKILPECSWILVVAGDYNEIQAPAQRAAYNILYIGLFTILIGFITVYFITRRISKPINEIIKITERIGKGNFKIESFPVKVKEFATIRNSIQRMSDALENRESELIQKNESIAVLLDKVFTLLDNSGEGFLSFGTDCVIESEYSRECEAIFGQSIAKLPVMDFLFPQSGEKARAFDKNIKLLLETSDEFKQQMLLSLLPTDLAIGNKTIKLKYRLLNNKRVMLILQDITHEKHLEELIKEEHGRLKFIVTSLTERDDFLEFVQDFSRFDKELVGLKDRTIPITNEELDTLLRQTHTYKGLSMQLDFIKLPQSLHDFETKLTAFKNSPIIQGHNIASAYQDSNSPSSFDMELQAVKGILGEDFLSSKVKITLLEEEINQLEKLYEALKNYALSSDYFVEISKGLDVIKNIRNVDLKTLLKSYPRYCKQLAVKRDKKIAPFEIAGDSIKVDPRLYNAFVKSLVHVFRNAVDHGIETPEERELLGKHETGMLSCEVRNQGGQTMIIVADDGRGIDIEDIKEKALNKGIITEEQANSMPEYEIKKLIFASGFSTSETVDEISGRGVGLSAVVEELQKLGGEVEINSVLGKGTTFILKISR